MRFLCSGHSNSKRSQLLKRRSHFCSMACTTLSTSSSTRQKPMTPCWKCMRKILKITNVCMNIKTYIWKFEDENLIIIIYNFNKYDKCDIAFIINWFYEISLHLRLFDFSKAIRNNNNGPMTLFWISVLTRNPESLRRGGIRSSKNGETIAKFIFHYS